VTARWGRLDVLFNNAGIVQVTPLLDLTEDDWDRVMEVNLKGAFFVMQAAARRMFGQDLIPGSELRGKLIQTASIASYRGGNHLMTHYSASKAGVVSFTRSAAQALAPHQITSNCICPGAVDTPMWQQIDKEWGDLQGWAIGEAWKRRTAHIPLGRPERAADLAGLVVFAAGARIGHFVALGLVALPLLISQVSGLAYRLDRVRAYRDMNIDVSGLSYQINQALIAMGSGGLIGRGFGHGQQKFGFLPEPHNDFILAMIGEEWGFVGVLMVIVLFALIALIGYRIARHAPDLFGFLLAIGLTNLIVVPAFLHMAVNLSIVPTTGVTLPFFSYGRSSLLVSLAAVGVLVNVARQAGRRTE